MEQAIEPRPPVSAERLAAPLKQVSGLLHQPAVKRAMPFLFVVGLIGAAVLAWTVLVTPPQRVLFSGLPDADKGSVAAALTTAGITNRFNSAGDITVDEDDYHRARMLLASQDLPKAAPGGYDILDKLPMGVSRAVEGERMRQARETELAKSIEEIDAVAEARVHLAMPENTVFVRDNASPSASVIVKLQPGRTLSDSQVRSIVNLVASSVPGMKAESVTIVDQMGALLSAAGSSSGGSAGDALIDYQTRVEDKYREQLNKLLTPLLGPGNFSAEIQADVDLDESFATSELFDKDGSAIKLEQGSYTTPDGAKGDAAGGIPGALSNAVPPPSALVRPTPTPSPSGTPAPGGQAGAGAVPPLVKSSENFTRSYDLGRQVKVTRDAPGAVTRLSVAVLLRDPDTGKPRSPVEIKQINDLVRAAVGFNAARGDQVTVISRKFSSSVTDQPKPAWYEAEWVPMVMRNGTALLIALLVLIFGVRPMVKGFLRKKADPEPATAPRLAQAVSALAPPPETEEGQKASDPVVSMEMLETARSYDDRVALVRGFTRDNPARAALAVRDMIQADAKS